MTRLSYPLRFVALVALSSLSLLVLCASMAIFLYRMQSDTADVLGENIVSRQAASDLSDRLAQLAERLRKGKLPVEDLHHKIANDLKSIEQYADKPAEKEFAQKLQKSFTHYLGIVAVSGADAVAPAGAILEKEMLRDSQELLQFNQIQVAESQREHRRTLRLMAWGLAGVGGLGSLAGLLFGYGVARALRQSIHRLQVSVRAAADKLGQDLPAVVMPEPGDLDGLNDQMRRLAGQVEQVVQQLQQREREVLRAEQLAAVGRLAAGVAHEIRNPLTSIKMLVQTSREETAARSLPSEDLSVIELEIRRIERSLQTFLDFARPPKLHRAELDLGPLVEHVLNLVRGRAVKQNVEVKYDRPRAPVVAEADGDQLKQVLVNLMLNALDAMPHGGKLDINLQREGGFVELRISDTGPGIAAAILPRLFEPFVSDKETGLGLGLSVSKRIAEDHDGTLRGMNRGEGGACFVLRLPAMSGVALAS
jgi:signal transduction histidine kinase